MSKWIKLEHATKEVYGYEFSEIKAEYLESIVVNSSSGWRFFIKTKKIFLSSQKYYTSKKRVIKVVERYMAKLGMI